MTQHKLVLSHRSPDEGIRLKNQLLADGLIMGSDRDFVWYYLAAEYDFTQQTSRRVVFEFRDAAMATYYGLKWI